ncbi:DUF4892 domain-containing protein [Pseudomonas sp. RL_15y_Pfl2_60]|uniref:DUF4892 domain-containing protein n=1 Tax=Pseudomonas sp. RL_15y_Pfl2_60 TaxID=3088709 RepID=UPI0030DBA8BA
MTGIRSVCVALAMVLSSTVLADVAGSKDLPVMPRFTGSQIVDYSEQAEQERIYPQGSIRRISGRLRYENEIQLKGDLTAITYRLPETHSSDQVFNSTREALLAKNAQMLYWCQGRDCGGSSLWANSVFSKSILYGPDDQQSFALFRLAEPQQDSILALYSITRGNRRAYLHAELLASDSALGEMLPTPATLLRQLRTSGVLNLSNQQEPTPAWVEVLSRALNSDSTMRVSLAGNNAESWREALVEQRVRGSRLELGNADVAGLQVNVLR